MRHIWEQSWPTWDQAKTIEETVEIPVQVDGKLRATVTVPRSAFEGDVRDAAVQEEGVQRHLRGREIVKEVYVPGKVYSIVTGEPRTHETGE